MGLSEQILESSFQIPSVGYIMGQPNPVPANFIFVTKDKGGREASWRRIDDVRSAWASLLQAAGVWSPKSEALLGRGAPPFHRHDLRRTWSAHAKASGLTVEEASEIMGNTPVVNMQHYRGRMTDAQLQEKTKQHSSNLLAGCIASVSEPNQDEVSDTEEVSRGESTA